MGNVIIAKGGLYVTAMRWTVKSYVIVELRRVQLEVKSVFHCVPAHRKQVFWMFWPPEIWNQTHNFLLLQHRDGSYVHHWVQQEAEGHQKPEWQIYLIRKEFSPSFIPSLTRQRNCGILLKNTHLTNPWGSQVSFTMRWYQHVIWKL